LVHYVNVQTIERFDDPRVAAFRNVKDAASRQAGVFLAESELVITRVFDSGYSIKALLVSTSRFERLASRIELAKEAHIARSALSARSAQSALTAHLRQAPTIQSTECTHTADTPPATQTPDAGDAGFPVFVCEQPILEAIVGFPLHRGCLAICYRPELPSADVLLRDANTVVVLDDVVDPDNIGSLFRHVAGFGADAVVLSANAGDPLYRKSVRASMGWVLEVPHTRLPTRESLLPTLDSLGFTTIALTPRRDAPTLRSVVELLRPTDRVALLVGAEAPGLTDHTIANATYQARIPMTEHVDSLNVATAGALALYELTTAHPNRITLRTAPPEWTQELN
jgi:tRNA G18 (ribose-2'-O)-methylase SpoU